MEFTGGLLRLLHLDGGANVPCRRFEQLGLESPGAPAAQLFTSHHDKLPRYGNCRHYHQVTGQTTQPAFSGTYDTNCCCNVTHSTCSFTALTWHWQRFLAPSLSLHDGNQVPTTEEGRRCSPLIKYGNYCTGPCQTFTHDEHGTRGYGCICLSQFSSRYYQGLVFLQFMFFAC